MDRDSRRALITCRDRPLDDTPIVPMDRLAAGMRDEFAGRRAVASYAGVFVIATIMWTALFVWMLG